VPADAYAALLDRLAGPDCRVVRYADGWHLLLRDHQRARVFADILAWLEDDAPTNGAVAACAAPTAVAVSRPARRVAAAPR
jgi:hypothetical protein